MTLHNTKPKINLSEVMRAAWAAYRRFNQDLPFCPRSFGRELRQAWFNAKRVAQRAAMTAQDHIRAAINAIENKDRLDSADYIKIASLRAKLGAA